MSRLRRFVEKFDAEKLARIDRGVDLVDRGLSAAGWLAGGLLLALLGLVAIDVARYDAQTLQDLVAQTNLLLVAAGLVVAAVAARGSSRMVRLTHELTRDSARTRSVQEEQWLAERADRVAAQARLVSAWCTGVNRKRHDLGLAPAPQAPIESVGVQVRNASALPIYGCTVLVRKLWEETLPASHVEVGSGAYWPVVPPGDWTRAISDVDLPDDLLTDPAVTVSFTDTDGRHWYRDTDGSLREVETNPGGVC